MSLLPVDLTEVIYEGLLSQRRAPDGLLHASSHLTAPMRHVQLELGGAPTVERPFVEEVVLMTGTFWHEWLEAQLKKLGLPVMTEVNVTPWLPKGWGGTADIVMWSPEHKGFVLVDLKTSTGEGIRWKRERGASESHVAQTSLYWHALKKMGLPMVKQIGVLYLPKNDTKKRDEVIEPVFTEFEPLAKRTLAAEAKRRRERVEEYRASLPKPNPRPLLPEEFITPELSDEPERVQRTYFNRKTGVTELKLVPPWFAPYCPFGELCSCSGLVGTSTKVGEWDDDGEYKPRKGYEEIVPEIDPFEEDE